MTNAARRDFRKYVHEMSREFEMECMYVWYLGLNVLKQIMHVLHASHG